MITRRGLFVVYLNLLLVTAIVTLAVGFYVREQKVESSKRQLYVDMLGVRCDTEIEANPDYCNYGDCKPLNIDDEEGPKICYCWPGYTSYLHVCDLQKLPQFNAFMSSFFGGWVGADWFYLFRTGTSGGYIAAGVFKLLTGGGMCEFNFRVLMVPRFLHLVGH